MDHALVVQSLDPKTRLFLLCSQRDLLLAHLDRTVASNNVNIYKVFCVLSVTFYVLLVPDATMFRVFFTTMPTNIELHLDHCHQLSLLHAHSE